LELAAFKEDPVPAGTYCKRIAFEILFVFIFQYLGREECFYITIPQ
jgi:hypothetical protein